MKKKQRNVIIGIVIILALLVILNSQGVLKLPLALTGTNTLSLSQATLQSSNSFLSGKVWLLTFSAGGLGQSYFGRFTPSDVQSATPDSSTTTKDFTVEVTYSDQVCQYPITQTSRTPVYNDLDRRTWSCLFNPSLETAKSKSGFSNVLYYGVSGLKCFAYGYNTKSSVGFLNSPDLGISYDIKITTPSGTATKTINPLDGSIQGQVGTYAYASWLGNLVSGKSCDDKDPYVPIYVNGVWRLGSADFYNKYASFILTKPTGASDDLWLSTAKNLISNTLISKSFGSIQSSTSLSNAIVKITKSNQIQFPVTALYIKASEIGIYTPTPRFEFVSTDSQCFKTGDEGNIAVTIRNDGESGTGNVYAQCSQPFQSTGNVQLSLNKGESKTVYLTLSASASKEERSSCTVFVESPGGIKSTSVNTCVKPQITCEANKVFCSIANNQEVIKQCSSDGATSTIIQTCTINQYCGIEDGKPICITGEKPGDGFWSNLWNGIKGFFSGVFNFTGGILNILRNVVVLIVGIFSTLFGKDLISSFRGLRRKEWLAWILALIIGLGLAYFVWKVFWVGLIIFIIFILFKFAIKLTPVGRFLR